MTARRIAVVVNGSAGSGRAGRAGDDAVRMLTRTGHDVIAIREADTSSARNSLADAIDGGADAVVAVGGDGTVHHVLQEVAGSSLPLGIVPAGSGDDIASSAGVPRDTDRAIAALTAALDAQSAGAASPTLDLALVRLTSDGEPVRWFGAALYCGFDGRVNARANESRVPGRARYPVAMVAELASLRPVPMSLLVDAETPENLQVCLTIVANGPSYGGGMQVVPHADVHDGLLDVMTLGAVGRAELLRVFPRVYRGTHAAHPAVSFRRGRMVTLDAGDEDAWADGEHLGTGPFTIEAVPAALRLLVPPQHA